MTTPDKYYPELLLPFFQREEIPKSAHFLVAYSGGLDSTVLAASLLELRAEHHYSITLAHVNHRLRADSGRDEAHCRRFATHRHLPLKVITLDPGSRDRESVEAWARRERYFALERLADELTADWILTAHHADDQAETVLMRLKQRSGFLSLAGIRPRRGRLLRPLLDFRRTELRAWAVEQGLAWVEDPSNADHRFLRNRLRYDLLEGVLADQPAAPAVLVELARMARHYEAACVQAASRLIDQAATGSLPGTCEIPLLAMTDLEADVFKLAVSGMIERRLGETCRLSGPHWQNFRHFVLSAVVGKVFDLNKSVQVLRDRDRLIFYRPGAVSSPEPRPLPVGITVWGRHTLKVVIHANQKGSATGLMVRPWSAGDKVKLASVRGHKLVSDIFIDAHLNRLEKDHWPVVAGPGNRALWVPGLAVPRREFESANWRITWEA